MKHLNPSIPSNEPEINSNRNQKTIHPSLNNMSELKKSPGLPILKFNIIHPIF
jgi:hypothetical protein